MICMFDASLPAKEGKGETGRRNWKRGRKLNWGVVWSIAPLPLFSYKGMNGHIYMMNDIYFALSQSSVPLSF